eukprot:symbB.v1.2.009308.t1/scaffold591.1/size328851/17
MLRFARNNELIRITSLAHHHHVHVTSESRHMPRHRVSLSREKNMAQKDLEQKVGLEQSFAVKQRTFQHFAMEAEQIERTTNQEVLTSEDHSIKAQEALRTAEGLLQEQNQESKQLEIRLREEASKGDHKAAMDAAAIAAARALLELVPFKDPSQSVPVYNEAPSVFSEAYNQNRTEESKHREAAGVSAIEEEPASPASPEAAPDAGDAEAVAPEEKARFKVWALKTPISVG